MDEMQKLYDAKEYDQVVELLLKAVTHPSQKPMVGRFCLILKELKSFDVSCLFSSVSWKNAWNGKKKCQFLTSILWLFHCTGNYYCMNTKTMIFLFDCIIFYFQRKESDSIVPARIEQLCLLHDCLVKMGDVKVQYIFNQYGLINTRLFLVFCNWK